jgi:hypothetical protein
MMYGLNKSRLIIAVALAAGFTLAGCLAGGTEPSPTQGEHTVVNLRLRLDPVSTALAKSATITLDKLVIVFTSSALDTIRDTITTGTTPALNATSTTQQTVAKYYNLATARSWKALVTIRDTRDSVIHRDSTTTAVLQASDTAEISLTLASRFTMYQARFLTIPDSIGSATAGTGKQKLYLNRLVFKIDGVTVRDSLVSPAYFTAGATHTLTYDYVSPGSHSMQMLAYGPMNSWDVANPLYSGSTTVNVGAGVDTTVTVNLSWVGPTSGGGNLSVTIGKVGTVTANGNLPTNVIP